MAIVKSIWLKGASKQLGGVVLYNAMGQTRSRELAANVANPRTTSQMAQRTKWANLVNFYRANSSWMKFAYETKKANQSEYNKFMSLNVAGSRIYLPKSIANQGGCVVDAYTMTQGSLPSIETSTAQGGWSTNLYLPNNATIPSTATVGEVAQMLLQYNPGLREGDQLSFIRFTQQSNSTTGVPYVIVRRYEVLLNSNDINPFYDFMPADYITTKTVGGVVSIFVKDSGNAGGFCLVLSRTQGGRTSVSTQDIVVANNSALIDAYSSNTALQAAIDSYGASTDPFLTSTSANQDSQAAVRPSVVAAYIDSQSLNIGQVAMLSTLAQDANIQLTVSQELTAASVDRMVLEYWRGGQKYTETLTEAEINDTNIEGSRAAIQYEGPIWIASILAETADGDFRAVFVVPNEATQGGLE